MEKDEKEYFVVTDETGKEMKCEIIMTFDSEEFGKSYVVYQIDGDETGEVFAAAYDPEEGEEGHLMQIETDDEWEFVEEVLENFLEDEEAAEAEHDHDHEHGEEDDEEADKE
ncbi:MAG TPA: hypothetical protein DCR44_01735 [Acholeplasmatales bacterium]|nr:DUF1292 domain-containing protein [Bacillota bacterium]OHE40327.1 MAG: hypothetical protein A2Y16_04175 [Tenericutes bacterium GWF2_57_13]HAQ56114.1 hypothetical protein [Acholeplasmatales bacterium]